ncbi:N-acetylglucosamine-6-phosphate deacetylase [Novosphingobium sp. 9U]|uniref:N-acetylglucosamine-6-phosphate deacetylase n=1 Tax=Novosphingobium sp. 9U TaxID=2653158 RepID=UPI0012EF48FA|nr:N-acetylglucosamine-6-phosphate deacetylase [Novosphingobium sp. 9U]VWX46716.1 N-acetylgalactosamine-6-phosphate deacetylase [Novosphingobium sp. 9U]
MAFALINGRVLVDGAFRDDVAVTVEGPNIVAIGNADAGVERIDLDGAMLLPGFVDSQVNGGGDVLFNAEPTVETIAAMGQAHARYGTTGFLPTLISDDLEVVRQGIAAVDDAIAAGVPGVLGIHIEGPFISLERKGIHSASHIRALDDAGLEVLTSLKRGRTLVTLAPERATPGFIRSLTQAGVIVAAGHTNGTYAQVTAAIHAGLTGFTHLFNAMSPLTSREPGAVGAALDSLETFCAIIVDGFHVSPVTMRLAIRCKAHDRFMLVTDAMPTTGGSQRSFSLQGRRIEAQDGRLVADDGTLAGSDLNMLQAVTNAVEMLQVPFEQAVSMATAAPCAFLQLSAYGHIAVGKRASMIAVRDGTVERSWVDGSSLQL